MAAVIKIVRRALWLNLMAAVPVYIYFMYEFKKSGMW
jgi:hypothetical protein